jgi:hypothetical protein
VHVYSSSYVFGVQHVVLNFKWFKHSLTSFSTKLDSTTVPVAHYNSTSNSLLMIALELLPKFFSSKQYRGSPKTYWLKRHL